MNHEVYALLLLVIALICIFVTIAYSRSTYQVTFLASLKNDGGYAFYEMTFETRGSLTQANLETLRQRVRDDDPNIEDAVFVLNVVKLDD